MVLTAKGDLMAIATGSDACAEHECGSEDLLTALTGQSGQTARHVAELLKLKSLKSVPSLEERRRIRSNLDGIVFEEGVVEGVQVAAIGFAGVGRAFHGGLLSHHELALIRDKKEGCAGAWDQGSFGFKVAGTKHVERLRAFAARVKEGQGIFAGTFLRGDRGMQLAGVCVAIEPLLRTEHRQAMSKAQQTFEANVRLQLLSREDELRELAWNSKVPGRSVVWIWAVWANGVVDGEVRYCVNPGYGAKWPGGTRTFDEVSAWLCGEEPSKEGLIA